MHRAFHYLTALLWIAIAYWLLAMHMLRGAIAALPSILMGMDPTIASRAREQVFGREFSWYALGSLIALAIAAFCVVTGSKKKPIQPLVPTRGNRT